MRPHDRPSAAWRLFPAVVLSSLALAGCGTSDVAPPPHSSTANPTKLPGTGKPLVTIGDKNFTEEFILGELYYEALKAEGFQVSLNQNIGPPSVTLQELHTGQLAMYPEYLNIWDAKVAHAGEVFPNRRAAYQTGQRYAMSHGLRLLNPTPFSDTSAIGTTFNYAVQHGLTMIGDLRQVGPKMTIGGPPQFEQAADGLTAVESAYAFTPRAYKSLEIGAQYQALGSGQVQAAVVNTTDGELTTGNYKLLADPLQVFAWGNAVPVVSARALAEEGPVFARTINRVSGLLSTAVIRELNAQVDLSGDDPAAVASQFLAENGIS